MLALIHALACWLCLIFGRQSREEGERTICYDFIRRFVIERGAHTKPPAPYTPALRAQTLLSHSGFLNFHSRSSSIMYARASVYLGGV